MYIRPSSASVNSFLKQISSLAAIVEQKMSALLPDRSVIVLDGWSSGLAH
eukprot:IDg1108t1